MSPRLEELETGGRGERTVKGGQGGENDSKHICPHFVCRYTHNHKHGRVQISLKCGLAACGSVSRPRFFRGSAGNHLSPAMAAALAGQRHHRLRWPKRAGGTHQSFTAASADKPFQSEQQRLLNESRSRRCPEGGIQTFIQMSVVRR